MIFPLRSLGARLTWTTTISCHLKLPSRIKCIPTIAAVAMSSVSVASCDERYPCLLGCFLMLQSDSLRLFCKKLDASKNQRIHLGCPVPYTKHICATGFTCLGVHFGTTLSIYSATRRALHHLPSSLGTLASMLLRTSSSGSPSASTAKLRAYACLQTVILVVPKVSDMMSSFLTSRLSRRHTMASREARLLDVQIKLDSSLHINFI